MFRDRSAFWPAKARSQLQEGSFRLGDSGIETRCSAASDSVPGCEGGRVETGGSQMHTESVPSLQ